jgi:DNA-binding response OmpR family regulator
MVGKPGQGPGLDLPLHHKKGPFRRRRKAMKYKLMIVDDDRIIRFTVRELFRFEGMEVVTANGEGQCIEEMAKGFKGVVLMDVMMPNKDGWDTIREIIKRDFYQDIIIVMLTAKDVPDQKMDGLQEYVTDYITKPFEPEELVSSVREYFSYLERLDKG